MTVGRPPSRLLQFSILLLIGNLAQQLYNTVDSIAVGRFVGDNALAAVGASSPVLNLLLVLFMGIASGGGIMASQYFGAKDREISPTQWGPLSRSPFSPELLSCCWGRSLPIL